MNQILSPLLTLILLYGYPIIVATIAIGYFGIPIPLMGVLLAAGSFAADGTLNLFVLIIIVTITAVIGDVVGYYLGMRFGYAIIRKTPFAHAVSETKINSLNAFLKRWGIWCIFLTRWLLTPLGIPINFTAGIGKYPFKQFLFVVICGELLWASLYLYLGYVFGSNWSTLLDYINDVPQLLVFIGIGVTSLYFGLKIRAKKPTY